MLTKLIGVLVLLSFTSFSGASGVSSFEPCNKDDASKGPSKQENAFLYSYLNYLKNGTPANGEAVLLKMQELAQSQGGGFSVKSAGIFEGTMEICCRGPRACYEDFGSASLKTLYPRVKKGWKTAIFIVLMYERFARTDGADSEGLNEYLEIIKAKHPWAISLFKKKYLE